MTASSRSRDRETSRPPSHSDANYACALTGSAGGAKSEPIVALPGARGLGSRLVVKPTQPDSTKNLLYYGDNLDVMRRWMDDSSVDLIYLDPPFNSNRSYNVLFKQKSGDDAQAQIAAFDDTWTWSQDDEQMLAELEATAPTAVADAIGAMNQLIGPSDMLSYLVMMTGRLIELRRVLRETGTVYLHCDPVASHYLKLLMDAVFGPANFVSEVVWQRTATKGDAKRKWGANHDVLLVYSKSPGKHRFVPQYVEKDDAYIGRFRLDDSDGRGPYRIAPLDSPNARPNLMYDYKGFPHPPKGWRVKESEMELLDADGRLAFPSESDGRIGKKHYLNEQDGKKAGDVWTDIAPLQSSAAEKLGYPTQKPLTLLERVITASSQEGDIVFDPFCGCGTTVDASQRLGRRWIGCDVSYLAIDLIETRLLDTFGSEIKDSVQIVGLPADLGGARALMKQSPFDFERWAVSLVNGTPNEKQVGDRGVDGIIRFPLSEKGAPGRVVVSVKGGKNISPEYVRDLAGTVEAEAHACMGVLISIEEPTKGMKDAANRTGSFEHPLTGNRYPKVQLLTVGDLLAGAAVSMPTPYMPYLRAAKFAPDEPTLF